MLSVNDILAAYSIGIFPMSDARDAPDHYWIEPQERGIIPLDNFNIPRSLKKFMRKTDYKVTINQAFSDVIAACAETPHGNENNTWINQEIESSFNVLHIMGYAHSVEVWDENGCLIGGLYGLAQGGCFHGESIFTRQSNAGKIALVHLVDRLDEGGFTLLDTQFVNDHLRQFNCIAISQADYIALLGEAQKLSVSFV
jgi:leucyl/phenylalanyl-tRNA--protein transferase